MLMPAREKFRKVHRGNRRGNRLPGDQSQFWRLWIESVDGGVDHRPANRSVPCRHHPAYEAPRGKLWIRIFPHKPITAKPAETRMGGGKGAPDKHVAVVKPGHVLFELVGVSEEIAREAFRLASHKLPLKVRFARRATRLCEVRCDDEGRRFSFAFLRRTGRSYR